MQVTIHARKYLELDPLSKTAGFASPRDQLIASLSSLKGFRQLSRTCLRMWKLHNAKRLGRGLLNIQRRSKLPVSLQYGYGLAWQAVHNLFFEGSQESAFIRVYCSVTTLAVNLSARRMAQVAFFDIAYLW